MRYYFYILHKATDLNIKGKNYVGKTKNIHARFNKHRSSCNDSTNSLYHLNEIFSLVCEDRALLSDLVNSRQHLSYTRLNKQKQTTNLYHPC